MLTVKRFGDLRRVHSYEYSCSTNQIAVFNWHILCMKCSEMAGGTIDPVKVIDTSVQKLGYSKVKTRSHSYLVLILAEMYLQYYQLDLAKRCVRPLQMRV